MNRDLLLEEHLKNIAARPQRKNEDTLTSFDRDVFWYNKNTVHHQTPSTEKVTYEDHRRAIEIAVNMLRKDTQREIAMAILTHRIFSAYRDKVFAGQGNFLKDYSYIIRKIGMVFNAHTSRVNSSNVNTQLAAFKTPTLVQINHIVGTVKEIKAMSNITLQEAAKRFNAKAPESTTYQVAGLSLTV